MRKSLLITVLVITTVMLAVVLWLGALDGVRRSEVVVEVIGVRLPLLVVVA